MNKHRLFSMWLILFGTTLLVLAGCYSPSIVLDPTKPIIVDFSAEWSPEQIEIFRAGVHYWDGLASFHLADEGVIAEQHILVVKDDSHGDEFAGEYDPSTGQARMRSTEVNLALGNPRWSPVARTSIAHELGHSIGLKHVPIDNAVMFRAESMLDGITANDVDEFYRVWPN